MRGILKARWLILIVWIAAVVSLFLTAPNMADLVREKGQITVPDGYSSSFAEDILQEVSKQGGGSEIGDTVLVFHNKDGLTADNLTEIEGAIQLLESKKEELGLTSVTSHFEQSELEDQLVAEDGKTIMALIGGNWEERSAADISASLYEAVQDVQVEHYFTSSRFIDEDVMSSSEEGLKRTELITVGFILAILFIVFRSAVAPLVPLLAVGISYLAAQSVVAFLVDWWNFPLSNFTQIFMVAVMFGIGTDYCILLISRFKEELAKRPDDVGAAVIETYRTAGKTVFFSGLAVMVGFASIGFSTFILYQSAAAVAVGVGVLLVALITLVPFFMAVLGSKLFWPSKGSLEHKPSRLWEAAGRFSLKRPMVTLLLIAVLVVPLLLTYDGVKSYNSLDEIGDDYNSVKAFNIISDSFGPGQSMPAKIVLKHDQPMDNSESLAAIERISREVAKVEGVESIRSATRPVGEEMKDLLVTEQVKKLDEGLGEGTDGLGQIREGLATASAELSKSAPELSKAASGAGDLVKGTDQIKSGMSELNQGLKQIEQGIRQGSSGAGELKQGLEQAKQSAEQLAAGGQELLAGYRQLESGISTFSGKYKEIEQGLGGIDQALGGMDRNFQSLAERYPELSQDQDFLTIQGTVSQLRQSVSQLAGGLGQLNTEFAKVGASLEQANLGLAQSVEGQTLLAGGFEQLIAGIEQLQMGMNQAADGQGQIVAKVPGVIQGLEQISAGQKEIQQGFTQLDGQLAQLTEGLEQSVAGLSELTGGLESAQQYLNGLAGAPDDTMAGWHIPAEVLDNEDFQQVFDTYMSPDRKVTTLDVVFTGNPYSTDTIAKIDEINAAVQRALSGTALSDASFGISGVTGMYADLNEISAADYSRTVVLMLVGIAIILILLLRSIIMPLYLILSLILTYFTSVAVTEIIFVDMLGYSGISWPVPFFAFVILVALGVDYSIFLMDRFNEYKHLPVEEALIHSMKNMGTVIISAAVILGGTFAAMLPSGVLSLLQIATIAITGLFLYAFVFMPFFVPVMVKTFGSANWWPFTNKEKAGSTIDTSM
ncbi:MMPL family transporter [Paenibacillus sp. J2TS4]|uniref:MMPL family transporter n=1 Tax=Paenibacillus sp. J2TS4 TaxID=2807194 RepID=UPI001B274A06|nr:MMPL family transporter [Paenibacillus sp. J2TS4]GIP35736.1 transporter [Paenibacillus sp. J2TS4]